MKCPASLTPIFSAGLLAFAGSAAAEVTLSGQVYPPPWALQLQDDLYIGDTLPGTMRIDASDSVSARRLTLARNPGVNGLLEIAGAGATMDLSSGVTAGFNGTATINILDGGSLLSSGTSVGSNATGSGGVTVSGGSSRWLIDGNLDLGGGGHGALWVDQGGRVTTRRVRMAEDPGSSALARIAGPGSAWEISSSLTVGQQGPATLEVLQGAALTMTGNAGITIGAASDAPSSVLLDGPGTIANASSLSIASGNTSTLTITNGAALTTGLVNAGIIDRGYADIRLDGAGSTWQVTSDMLIGNRASAALWVGNGARLDSQDAWLGAEEQGDGVVTVTGAGTRWDLTGSLLVGAMGTGQLSITDQAVVAVAGQALVGVRDGFFDGFLGGGGALHLDNATLIAPTLVVAPADLTGSGTIQTNGWVVDGDWQVQSLADLPTQQAIGAGQGLSVQLDWAQADGLFGVGYEGTGTATINGGFTHDSAYSVVGYGSQADGRLELTAPGTAWDAGRLAIGHAGAGAVTVSDQATLVFEAAVLGERAGSRGTLRVDGAGSTAGKIDTFRGGPKLTVGRTGAGHVTVTGGGTLRVGEAVIGDQPGAVGVVDLTDQGQWLSDTVTLGHRGHGIFTATDGATVVAPLRVGDGGGGLGQARIHGEGTTWSEGVWELGHGWVEVAGGAVLNLYDVELASVDRARPYQHTHVLVRDAGTQLTTRDLVVGQWGTAMMRVRGGAALSTRDVLIGSQAGSVGELILDGPGTTLGLSFGTIRVGEAGRGTLTLRDGAAVTARGLVIGAQETGVGRVNVSGPGTLLDLELGLYLYYGDQTALHIDADAVVNAPVETTLFRFTNPRPEASIVLDRGVLNTGRLVGGSTQLLGQGTISADSMLLDGDWSFSADTPLPGRVLLDALPGQAVTINLAWADTDGVFGTGTSTDGSVRLHTGARIDSATGYVGLLAGGTGAVTVEDQRSRWTISDWLYIGLGGTGDLRVRSGGIVNANRMMLGRQAGASGAVRVDGAGSVVDVDNVLQVGYDGAGALRVQNSALLLADGITAAENEGSTGEAHITGLHSALEVRGAQIGYGGNATLRIDRGAIAYLGTTTLGYRDTGFGALNIDGVGTFAQTAGMLVSRGGNAELSITNGARVESQGLVRLGGFFVPDEQVTAVVSGPQTSWSTHELFVGKAHLDVADGATLNSHEGILGVWSNNTASATFRGAGTAWTIRDTLILADRFRPARLNILQGAAVRVGTDLVLQTNGELVLGLKPNAPTPLTVGGNAALGGQLALRLDPAALPVDQSTTVLIDIAGSQSGAFDGLAQGGLLGVQFGVAMQLRLDAGDGNDLGVVARHVAPGDADGSGVVDADDLALILLNWGNTVEPGDWSAGDLNHDGLVGAPDLEFALRHWQPAASQAAAVPEPNTLASLGLIGLALLRRRARTRSAGATGNGNRRTRCGGAAIMTATLACLLTATAADAEVAWSGAVYPAPIDTELFGEDLFIGYNTAGTLDLSAGSTVTNPNAYLGYYPTADAVVTVAGTGSLWHSSATVYAGYRGNAVINVNTGGRLQARALLLGYDPTTQGEVTVAGPGTTLDSDGMTVGYTGLGRLTVEQGAVADVGTISLGVQPGGWGDLLVQGPGSKLIGNLSLLGSAGAPTSLTVRDGARLENASVHLGGQNQGATPYALAEGTNTTWRVTGQFLLGTERTEMARVDVRDGAALTSGSINVGSGGPAIFQLDGPRTRWVAGNFTVGTSAQGLIQITHGAIASGSSGYLGNYIGDHGTVAVDGPGSTWNLSRDLYLGVRDGAESTASATNGGRIRISGDLMMNAWATLRVGLDPGSTQAPIDVANNATLAGRLQLSPDDDAALVPDHAYPLLDITRSRTGVFDGLNEGDIVDVIQGVAFNITYTGGDGNDVYLNSTAALPGDLDGSGAVDHEDLARVLNHFGQAVEPGRWMLGDADNDGWVGPLDLDQVLMHWSADAPTLSVPEPAGIAVLLLTGLSLLRHDTSRRARPRSQAHRR